MEATWYLLEFHLKILYFSEPGPQDPLQVNSSKIKFVFLVVVPNTVLVTVVTWAPCLPLQHSTTT